jgi:uncharacterized repeat protein (TIGR03847 family)
MSVFEYVEPQRFVAGTVGEPGQRTFYLQAHDGARTTSVALEKGQVAVLAERLDDLLDALLRQSGGALPIPAVVTAEQLDNEPLVAPIEEEFRAVGLSLMWDDEVDRVVIEAHSTDESDNELASDDLSDPELSETQLLETQLSDDAAGSGGSADVVDETLRVVLTGTAARAFATRAQSVVAAGRPPCPFCALPLDPEGHICPRQNGYLRQ